jgi:hypothetical protein
MSGLWSSTKGLLRSPGCASTASLFTLFYLLSIPGKLTALLAIAAALWTSWAFFRCRLGRADGVLLGAMTLALATGTALGLSRVSLEAHDDDYWQQRVERRLDEAEAACIDALSDLVEEARQRATAALVLDADLEALARPLDFLGRPLEVGVSLWREGKLQDWAGSVTGPQRLPAQSRPLLVDHNFRRYLTLSVSGDETGVCRVDVSMGLRGDFFADVGVWPDPAAPLRESTGVDVEVVAVESDAADDFDRWIGVP